MKNLKLIIYGVSGVIALILFLIINPFSVNDGGSRTVVQTMGGKQFVQFGSGVYYSGFFSKETEWPNQISVLYQAKSANNNIIDNGIEIGQIGIMFNDKTTALCKGITQYVLPGNEKEMIQIHNTHRTPQSLVSKRLAPYTKECLQASAQLMSFDMHSGGGRAQMAQDFSEQLKGGVYLLKIDEKVIYDSLLKEPKRIYQTQIQLDDHHQQKRKISSIKEYGITVADALIIDVDYEARMDDKLAKIIESTTKLSISKQDLMTAQQQMLTSKAQGEKKLVDIEYLQKEQQTKELVQAETKVKVAEQDKLQQKIAYEGAILEAKKIKELADAEAYKRKAIMIADGALEKKIEAYVKVSQFWAQALSEYSGAITPTYQMGASYAPNGNGFQNFMELQNMKAMRDLNIDIKNK